MAFVSISHHLENFCLLSIDSHFVVSSLVNELDEAKPVALSKG